MAKHLDDTQGHPILRFLDVLEKGLDEIAQTPAWSLTTTETTEVVTRLEADLARLAEVEARTITQAETLDLHGAAGAKSIGVWLAMTTRLTRTEAERRTRLAKHLVAHDQTRHAMTRGAVLPQQAVVISKAVEALEDTGHRDAAEAHLIKEAAHFDAHKLAELGRRILETVDPDKADAHEAKLLEKQEARAAKKTQFRLYDDGEGLSHGRFTIPTAQAEMLRKALQALAAPKHVRATEGAGSYDYEKPTPEKLGKAFCEYVERFPADKLPSMGGINATIIVTVDVETLRGAHQAAHLDTGHAISPGQLRRWACEAKILPAVMDGASHVLDLGRSKRFHTAAQRTALSIEQQTCQHPTCDTPGAFCHTHHNQPWSEGGVTNTQDAALLCPFHHHQAHATGASYPLRT